MPPSLNHKNEQRKKKSKGQSNGVAAVLPVQTVQPQVEEKPVTPAMEEPKKLPQAPVNPIRVNPPRPVEPQFRGQIAKPQAVSNASVVGAVADMIHSTIPLSPTSPADQPEKIEWVELHRCPVDDSSRSVECLVIGLARGFQIWLMNEELCWEEVLSERQGPLRLGKLLPHKPVPLSPNDKDSLGLLRPLFALVDASSPNPDKMFCSLTILSLPTAQKMNKLTFDEPIASILASDMFTVLAMNTFAAVLDSLTLTERFRVNIATPSEGFAPAISLCSSFLAFAHPKAEHVETSCGGLSMEQREQPSVTGQVLQALSRTMNSLNESVSGSGNRGLGLVGVAHLSSSTPSNISIIARFLAHLSPISHLSFGPDGRCLMTADESGNAFNVFILHPHPANITLGAVQHVYRLHRGNTPAKIISSSWTVDGRWLSVATNHGTSHIFAVCPYGGPPSNRTHSLRLANRESRFLRSAGLTDENMLHTPIVRERTHSGSPLTDKKHVALEKGSIGRSSLNPRIGPFPPPITLNTIKKIRESALSADKLSAWASDLTPTSLSSGLGRIGVSSVSRLSVLFASNQTLLIARADGVVCAYDMKLAKFHSADDVPRLDVVPSATWTLTRTKKGDDVRVPLPRESTLMNVILNESGPSRKTSTDTPDWIPQVETHPYSAPHRRLWQGPQFSFYCYKEERTPNLVPAAQKCVPIVVGGSTGRPIDSLETTRIECGSWSSEKERYGVTDEMDDISKAINEAMKEVHVDHEDSRVSDEEFFDTASGGPRLNDKKEDLLQFEDDEDFSME